jgi:hypothetical protein
MSFIVLMRANNRKTVKKLAFMWHNNSQVIGYREMWANTIFLFVYELNRKITNNIPKEG